MKENNMKKNMPGKNVKGETANIMNRENEEKNTIMMNMNSEEENTTMNTMTNNMMNIASRTMTKGLAKRAAMLAFVSVMATGTVMPVMAATAGGTMTGTTLSAESVSDQTLSVSSYVSLGKVKGLGYTIQSSTEYGLSWNAVSGATGYEIYRSVDGSTKWIKVNTTTKTSHIAGSALTAGNKYYFRVRAYKTAGSSTTYGSYSSAISFTFGEAVAVTGVSLNASSATLKVGKTKTLKATITPSNATNKTVTWSSSDTAVAKVSSSGKVTAKKAGTVTITAKTANGKKAACRITVNADVSKVKSSTTQVLLAVGNTKTVSVKNLPSGMSASWKSSDTSVASVTKKGKIKAKKTGNCIVYTTVGTKTVGCAVSVTTQKKVNAIKKAKSIAGTSTYSKAKRMLTGYYDCSSLVWRAYSPQGYYFGNTSTAPTAADIALYLNNNGKLKGSCSSSQIQKIVLQAGDLGFSTGANNDRYKGIYHVEMFAGYDLVSVNENGKATVEPTWASDVWGESTITYIPLYGRP